VLLAVLVESDEQRCSFAFRARQRRAMLAVVEGTDGRGRSKATSSSTSLAYVACRRQDVLMIGGGQVRGRSRTVVSVTAPSSNAARIVDHERLQVEDATSGSKIAPSQPLLARIESRPPRAREVAETAVAAQAIAEDQCVETMGWTAPIQDPG
jgi:hypothetical protein